ncbi:hypothetical protein LPTSP3_g33010 [Leptospira kobayashii]|uniref:Uncharacterized protein n=1 Tax=Leptospira kobayashii TaxID=1917830 RepID=A0ABN6KJN9_9LEPT|nr:hypothetical protein [Leptospira kobayashii]BDA80371.1 hypothetical protein LPTSP3_g33010 [Leptospira kobayashii]
MCKQLKEIKNKANHRSKENRGLFKQRIRIEKIVIVSEITGIGNRGGPGGNTGGIK